MNVETNAPEHPRPRGADREAFVGRLQRIVGQWRSADRLARAMGVSPSAFRKWLKGEAEPSRERLVALADAAGVGVGWLAKGEGPEPRFREPPGPSGSGLDASAFLTFPKRLDGDAGAGPAPAPPSDPTEPCIAFGHDWLRRSLAVEPEDLLLELAVGNSMRPTIQDGDLLLIDTADRQFRDLGVYVVEYAGVRLVKRVQRKLDGGLLLISDNPAYEPERIPSGQTHELTALGRVVWSGGKR